MRSKSQLAWQSMNTASRCGLVAVDWAATGPAMLPVSSNNATRRNTGGSLDTCAGFLALSQQGCQVFNRGQLSSLCERVGIGFTTLLEAPMIVVPLLLMLSLQTPD